MQWDVVLVQPLDDHRLYVEMQNGSKGIFDVKPYLEIGAFRELKDPWYFQQVAIVYGAIVWPHEQDIAPETLLAEWIPVTRRP